MFPATDYLLRRWIRNVLPLSQAKTTQQPCLRLLPVILLSLALQSTGCKPTPPSSADPRSGSSQEHSAGGQNVANGQPTAEDVAGFLRVDSPPFVRVVDVKMDAPVILPNTSPAQRLWLCSVRFALQPSEDLLGPSPDAEAHAFQATADELASWTRWREAYVLSPYTRIYPAPEWRAPASLVAAGQQPLLLSCLHPASQPLPPTYAKLRAEWQVDHWQFRAVDFDLPEAGEPRTAFQCPNVVLGSPEAVAFVQAAQAAIVQAKSAKAAIDTRYQADLVKAARPGVVFRGQLTHRGSVVPAEVRLLPTASGDAQEISLEVHLPATPGESFTYVARLAGQVPLPASTTPEADAPSPVSNPPELSAAPKGDLRLRLLTSNGKERPLNDMSLPNELLFITRHYEQPSEVWLRLNNGHLEGRLGGYSTDSTGFVLTAIQQQGRTP